MSWSWATSISSGPMPAVSNAAAAASTVAPSVISSASHGLNTSNVPKRRVRNSTALTSIGSSRSSRALPAEVSTTAAPPSLGEQNM